MMMPLSDVNETLLDLKARDAPFEAAAGQIIAIDR